MALVAHVVGLDVLVEGVFGDFCTHLQVVRHGAAVGQVAARAGHLTPGERIDDSTNGMALVWMAHGVV